MKGPDHLIVKAYEDLCHAYNLLPDNEKCKDACQQAYSIHLGNYNHISAAKFANKVSIVHWRQGQYKQAHIWADKIIEHTTQSGNLTDLSSAYLSKGNIYRKQAEIDSAIYYYHLSMRPISSSPENIAFALTAKSNIAGLMITKNEDTNQAIAMLQEVYQDATNQELPTVASSALNLQASAYIKMNQPAKDSIAKELLTLIIENDEGINNTSLPTAYLNLGLISKRAGQYDIAMDYYQRALKIIKTKPDRTTVFANLGTLYRYQSLADSSLFYLHLAEELAETQKDSLNLLQIYFSLGKTYTDIENIIKASEYYEKALYMSQMQTNETEHVTSVNTLTDSLFVLRRDVDVIKQRESRAKRRSLVLFLVLVLSIIVGLGIIYRMGSKKKILAQESGQAKEENQKLIKQIKIIEEKNLVLRPNDYVQQTLTLSNRRKNMLKLGAISYITVVDKMLVFHLIDSDTKFKMDGTLKEFHNKRLSNIPIFVQVHRAFIFNILDIKEKQETELTLSGDIKIPVSRRKKKTLHEALAWLKSTNS
ncbi:MAG: LytTR family transcriptional regulator DNA-binding domain-containing protein [Cyanobacteria bacterium J06649_11]